MNKKIRNTILVALTTFTLVGCGGGGGGSDSGVTTNTAPVLTTPANVSMEESTSRTLTLSASDKEKDSLTYTATANSNSVTIEVVGDKLTLTANEVDSDKEVQVSVTVSDGKASNTESFTVTVKDLEGGTTNTAPVLNTPANVSMEEGTSRTLTLSASDKEKDSLTYTATANSDSVTIEVVGDELKLTANEVDSDKDVQVSVTVSDGEANDTESFTVTVKDLEVVDNTPPSVILNPTSVSLEGNETKIVAVTLSDKESSIESLVSEISVSDTDIVSVSLNSQGNVEVTGNNAGTAVVTYTAIDEGGLSTSVQLVVSVVESDNEEPDFNIVGQSENTNEINIYHDRVSVVNVSIIDPDSDSHYLSLTNFKEVTGNFEFMNEYYVNNQNKTITFDFKALPTNMDTMIFEMELSVKDSSDNEVSKVYNLIVEESDNAAPVFNFTEQVGAFVIVEQNEVKEFTYTIEDDNASKVEVSGMQYWYGDQSKFDVQLDTENQKITVTTTDVEVQDSYGFVLQYVDSNITGNVYVELMVGSKFGENEQEMLDLKNKMIKARESVKEYVYVGAFYSQALENLGYITEEQAEDFMKRLDIDDSTSYSYGRFNLYINNIDYYISIGEFKDQGFKDSYITVINNLFEQAQTTGRNRYTIINEMAELSNETLPLVEYESVVNEYDVENNYFSRFVGNVTYGEYVNGEWVFDSEYAFLEAVNAQMIQNALKNIGS